MRVTWMSSPCLVVLVFCLASCQQKSVPEPNPEWYREPLPLPPDPYPMVTAIGGTGVNDVWAMANGGIYHYDGHWSRWPQSEPIRASWSVAAVAKNDVWAVGSHGSVAHFDGSAWTAQELPGVEYDLVHVAAWPGSVWATGASNTLHHFDGKSWSQVAPEVFADARLHQLFGTGPNNIYVVISDKDTKVPRIGHFDGSRWSVFHVGRPGQIGTLHGTAANDIWAVGWTRDGLYRGGQIHHFDGTTWTETPIPEDVAVWSVYATSRDVVWAAADKGRILRWDGHAWHKSPSGVTEGVSQVFAPPGGPPLVVGSVVLRHK